MKAQKIYFQPPGMKIFVTILIALTAIPTTQAQFKNYIVTSKFSPNEPSIAMHPSDPYKVLVGVNLKSIYASIDGGKKWRQTSVQSDYGVWGDPVMAIDKEGTYYYFHLSNPPKGNWIDRIVCQKSSDEGKTWSKGTYFGLNGKKAQDKHWIVIDEERKRIYATWTQFDKYGSATKEHKSNIHFTRSDDMGGSWSTAKRINEVSGDCIDSSNTTEGAVPALGPNGEIYVAWAGPSGLVFDRSKDGGETWLDKDILIDNMPGGWDYEVEGLKRCNGMPITLCDPNTGTIYVHWSDQRNGEGNTDLFFSKSTDEGMTWTPAKMINQGNDRDQFMSWIALDPSNGNLYCVYYDRSQYTDEQTDVFLSYSSNGGDNWKSVRISKEPFVANPKKFFGDYTNITFRNGKGYAVWTRMDKMKTSVLVAPLNADNLPTR